MYKNTVINMKRKTIIFAVIFAALLMLLTPTISAVKTQAVEKTIQEQNDYQRVGLRNLINRILGFAYFPLGVMSLPFSIVIGILLLFVGPFALWLIGDAAMYDNVFELVGDVFEAPLTLMYLGLYLIYYGEWPDLSDSTEVLSE